MTKSGMVFSLTNYKVPLLVLCITVCLLAPLSVSGSELLELESSFNDFLVTYIKEIQSGDTNYLKTIHPKLPEEQRDFFVSITLDMMKYANDNNLSPTISCREYNICKATWPQPGDSWAAQTFIRHKGEWKWLDY